MEKPPGMEVLQELSNNQNFSYCQIMNDRIHVTRKDIIFSIHVRS